FALAGVGAAGDANIGVCVFVHVDRINRSSPMPVVPNTQVAKIEFYENHNTPWAANAVAIGTTAAAVTDLATKTTAARAAFNAQQAAQDSAKAATLTLNAAVSAMATAGAVIISAIHTKGKSAGDSVYALAQIP